MTHLQRTPDDMADMVARKWSSRLRPPFTMSRVELHGVAWEGTSRALAAFDPERGKHVNGFMFMSGMRSVGNYLRTEGLVDHPDRSGLKHSWLLTEYFSPPVDPYVDRAQPVGRDPELVLLEHLEVLGATEQEIRVMVGLYHGLSVRELAEQEEGIGTEGLRNRVKGLFVRLREALESSQ